MTILTESVITAESLRTMHPDALPEIIRAFGNVAALKSAIISAHKNVSQFRGVKKAIEAIQNGNGNAYPLNCDNSNTSGIYTDMIIHFEYSPWIKARVWSPECRWPLVIPVASFL